MNSIVAYELTKQFNLVDEGGARRSPLDWILRRRSNGKRFVALESVSFTAQPGQVIGIIGRNGAGKSTLLKLLSRILRPTSGRIELYGRVGSLLEIGTGFHPELTGRENIFLNGAILGMGRSETLRKLDAIVDFAEIGSYLDQPVKDYSSGMYMRLAFAIAAHIEPEILLLDEILAVGDADFQKKCMARIDRLGQDGQTVIFVSHNMPAILRHCNRAFLLQRGRLISDGTPSDVAAVYLGMREPTAERRFADIEDAPGSRDVKLRSVRVRTGGGETVRAIDIGSEFGIEMEFVVLTPGVIVFPAVIINAEYGELFRSTDVSTEYHGKPRRPGLYRVVAWIPANLLVPGPLTVSAAMYSRNPYIEHFAERDIVSFSALETEMGSRGHCPGYFGGAFRPWLEWSVAYEPSFGRGHAAISRTVGAGS